ncbi:hypothetical protein S245_039100, partial [Arachis hypogaea]
IQTLMLLLHQAIPLGSSSFVSHHPSQIQLYLLHPALSLESLLVHRCAIILCFAFSFCSSFLEPRSAPSSSITPT